jgi:hypothetical protein
MHAMTQLKQLREQMIEELTRIPQYRALKAMERFMNDMSTIYEEAPDSPEIEKQDIQHKIAQAIESRVKNEPVSAVTKKPAYIPVHRVA